MRTGWRGWSPSPLEDRNSASPGGSLKEPSEPPRGGRDSSLHCHPIVRGESYTLDTQHRKRTRRPDACPVSVSRQMGVFVTFGSIPHARRVASVFSWPRFLSACGGSDERLPRREDPQHRSSWLGRFIATNPPPRTRPLHRAGHGGRCRRCRIDVQLSADGVLVLMRFHRRPHTDGGLRER